MIYFSAATGGFYDDAIHAQMPGDVRPVDAITHLALLDAQTGGMTIAPDANGDPQAVDPVSLLTTEELMERLRADRDRLLSACDWTQMPDSALTDELRADWAAYRQALRDLPETVSDPAAVEWPVAPA